MELWLPSSSLMPPQNPWNQIFPRSERVARDGLGVQRQKVKIGEVICPVLAKIFV